MDPPFDGTILSHALVAKLSLWYHLVVSYIRFNAYGNGMGTLLIASLAAHRLICHCVASLLALNLAPPTRSRSLRSSLGARRFSCLRKKRRLSLICSAAYVLGPAGLWPCGGAGNPHPLLTTLIDVCLRKHQWRHLVAGFPLP